MEDSVKQRLRGFLKEQNMSINQISLNANYPQSTLNKQINKETSMSLSTLLVLLDLFSELSAEWLLRGEGNMLRIATSNDTSASSDDKVKDVAYWKHVALSMSEEVTEKKDRIKELERELQRLGDELDQRLLKEERRGASGNASKTA
ncbi:hypothetical protein [Parabacteroides distasonis]|uniref:hypothetical protein n=1 Tax=Parabacteroides distasonis TaxID=823 RepID=UPI0018980260|nr:hypothetical protein [Parabacteroides distasonis]MDB9189385.1 hypothetical protein [Parabacteroides distasonis]MDB9198559.1 hypothetical protein [Parabacteroides distasonis]